MSAHNQPWEGAQLSAGALFLLTAITDGLSPDQLGFRVYRYDARSRQPGLMPPMTAVSVVLD